MSLSQSRMSWDRSTSSTVQKLATAFLYISHRPWYLHAHITGASAIYRQCMQIAMQHGPTPQRNGRQRAWYADEAAFHANHCEDIGTHPQHAWGDALAGNPASGVGADLIGYMQNLSSFSARIGSDSRSLLERLERPRATPASDAAIAVWS